MIEIMDPEWFIFTDIGTPGGIVFGSNEKVIFTFFYMDLNKGARLALFQD
jgi:hypothetical protein